MARAVVLTKRARKDLQAIDSPMRERIARRIDTLGNDPLPDDAKPLRGAWEGYYRIRVGDYRVIYAFDEVLVTVVRILQRKDAYR